MQQHSLSRSHWAQPERAQMYINSGPLRGEKPKGGRSDLPMRRSCANIPKASLKRAVTLAKSRKAIDKVVKDIEDDYFANSSRASKQSKRNTAESIFKAAFGVAFFLTVKKLKCLLAPSVTLASPRTSTWPKRRLLT